MYIYIFDYICIFLGFGWMSSPIYLHRSWQFAKRSKNRRLKTLFTASPQTPCCTVNDEHLKDISTGKSKDRSQKDVRHIWRAVGIKYTHADQIAILSNLVRRDVPTLWTRGNREMNVDIMALWMAHILRARLQRWYQSSSNVIVLT